MRAHFNSDAQDTSIRVALADVLGRAKNSDA